MGRGLFPILLIGTETVKKRMGKIEWSEVSRTDKIVVLITRVIIMPFTMVYSFFLPLKLGTAWFYVGIPLCFLGIVMGLMAGVSFATAPLDKPMTKGVYSVSRHPIYFGGFLEYVGIGIASASWIFLLCAAVWVITWRIGVANEERFLVEKYGNAYREYMNRTPRWIGMPRPGKNNRED